jgi:ArsR family transcriptional regulator
MIDILKAVADESRLRLINLLIRGELCVCEIEVITGLSQSNVSRHLTKLKQAGIITSHKEAQWMYYKMDDAFEKEHIHLMVYLKEYLEGLYPEDIQYVEKYKDSDFTCIDIRDNKDNVIVEIKL